MIESYGKASVQGLARNLQKHFPDSIPDLPELKIAPDSPPPKTNQCSQHAIDSEREEFEKVCRPVSEYLQKKSAHHRAIIDWSTAVLVQDLLGSEFKVRD